MLAAVLGTGSLIYFPIKIHFMLVLRSFWKEKRDLNESLALQALKKQMQDSQRQKNQIQPFPTSLGADLIKLARDHENGNEYNEVIPGMEVPESARKGLIEFEYVDD